MSGKATVPEADVRAFLADPQTHGLPMGARIERIETHASMVFLAGDRAYKLKKAVKLPYLDFSSLDKRLAAARREVEINRTFSPALYRGLGGVVGQSGALRLAEELNGDRGALVAPLVVMNRFDHAFELDKLADKGALDDAMADRLGIMAAEMGRKAEVRALDWPAEFRAVVLETLEEIEAAPALFDPARAAALRGALTGWLESRHARLADRCAQGAVRRCHGDLHLKNIYCRDGLPQPFDALEFDETLASTDILYDLAFLLMDLHARGMAQAAARVLGTALSLSGDHAGAGLLPGYLTTRALIRAKILATQIAQHPAGGTEGLKAEAGRYFALAETLMAEPAARLVAVGGLSGTGKTSCAFGLAAALGGPCVVVRSDVVRKLLLGIDLFAQAPESGYAPEVSARVYARMLDQAEAALGGGAAVVLDAVFGRAEERAACERLAEKAGVPFQGLWLEAPLDTRLERIEGRGPDASDAGPSLVRRQKGAVPGRADWHRIASTAARPAVVAEALKAIGTEERL